MTKWEIRYASNWSEAERLSFEEWELVSVAPALFIYSIGFTYFYFKRAL